MSTTCFEDAQKSRTTSRKGYVILLQDLGQHVNLLLHTRVLRMIAVTIVCTLAQLSFVLLLLGVVLGTLGLQEIEKLHTKLLINHAKFIPKETEIGA